MSGGSFNYLCHKDVTQIIESGMHDLLEMSQELRDLGHLAKEPAERTQALYERLRGLEDELNAEVQALEPIWHAVEWWRSCDYGRDRVVAELGAYRERQKSASKPTNESETPDG